ncbi:unnamed protein product [Lactuca virosa]|uniref:U-box domain-containing protein n=1 Tax=Lactuca virosa TaxID=75947 RepID=A0AAU9LWV4_9ASTR|nr:unnamed protein product [Lactuca virosa]
MVSTGQTYERSYIQRWINLGNKTCPKSCQKLKNLTLTPNYALRSLIAEWCTNQNLKPPKKINPIVEKVLIIPTISWHDPLP